jgi:membrane protease YdiL (CAAX protease family)
MTIDGKNTFLTVQAFFAAVQYIEYIQVILLFGLVGCILLLIAKSKGYFVLPHTEKRDPIVNFKTVLIVFAIYLGMTMLVAPVAVHLIKSTYALFSHVNMPIAVLGWIQLLTLITIFVLFYLYSKTQGPDFFKRIWKDKTIPHPKPILTDFLIGVMTWFISFPLVIAIGQLADMLLFYFFGFENYEQVAVRYLKTTLNSLPLLAVALFTILLAAPVIEEFLFRGCLQTFFKRYFPPQGAIVLSALCFSLFHFAPSQGIGNISLVASLFLFALFLGFIYERQASLFASIGLHMTFNTVSTCRILFFPE